MASLDLQITFFMSPGHFTMDQMYGFKIKDHQLFFPQAYGTEVNYYPFLDLSADNLSDQGHIPGIWDKGYRFRLMEQDVYWKQDQSLRVLHWLPSDFYLTFTDKSITLGSISKCTWCHTKKFSMKSMGTECKGTQSNTTCVADRLLSFTGLPGYHLSVQSHRLKWELPRGQRSISSKLWFSQ